MDKSGVEYGEYLSPSVLAKISGLELRARLIVEGCFGGMHHSPHHGLSVEFADRRAYAQGDDIRHIDWKVYGRTNKYFIKEYEQETNLDVLLVVDCSESMAFCSAGQAMSKHDYATSLAAAISYLALQQHDAVGLALFDERITQYIRPSNSTHQWKSIIRELAGKTGPVKTDIGRVFEELVQRIQGRCLVIIISDLFDDADVVTRGLRRLRYRRQDIIVWNTWDPAELTLGLQGPVMFDGLESAGRVLVDPVAVRARYLEAVQQHQSKLRMACGKMQIDYTLTNTGLPLDSLLAGYLATRSARLRQRSSRVMGGG